MERSKIKILIIATLMHSESIVKEKKKKNRGIHHNRDVPTHALMFVNLEW